MKIALIKPTIGSKLNSLYVDEGRMEPLQLGIIAAMIPDDIEVVLYDDRMEKIPFDEHIDIAMITVETFTAKRAYEISAEYKKRGVKVVMGGVQAMLIPDEVMEHCDSIIIGDMETIIDEFIADLRKNKLKKLYKGTPARIPQDKILTRRDLFKGKNYLPLTLMQFSRGCVHNCNYCAVSKYFDRQHYCRNIEEVVEEIKSQDRKLIFFVDDNLIANKPKIKEFLKAIIPLKIKWVSQGSMDMLYDDELMELVVKSGGLAFVIGFESISEASLDCMKKNVNKSLKFKDKFDKYAWEVERLRYWGMQTWGSFTIGHDTDTSETIKATLDFAMQSKFAFAAFNVLMPYPNTPLYNQLKEENRLLYGGKWWLHPDYKFNYAAFKPKNMSSDELTELGMYCRKKFNSLSSLIYRSLEPRTNMSSLYRFMLYWFYTPIFKKEVFKKHGMFFGLDRFLNRGVS